MASDFVWQATTPESKGISGRALDAMRDTLAVRRTRTLLIVRGDRIVYEWYGRDFPPNRRHYTASLAKSLVGGLGLALALQDGLLGLSDYACDYIRPWQTDPAKSQIRVLHLATHCSGLDDAAEEQTPHGLLPGWKKAFWERRADDPFTIARDQAPVVADPGTRFLYSNPGSAMLAYAITAALQGSAHEDFRTLLRERIFQPIGIEDDGWEIGYGTTYHVDGLPLVPNWAGASFTARATAQLGRLLLRRGDWQDQPILDPHWVHQCTQYAATPLPDRAAGTPWPAPTPGWWSNVDGVLPGLPRDAFCGAGSGNQILLVIPSLDMIVVRNGGHMGDSTNPVRHVKCQQGSEGEARDGKAWDRQPVARPCRSGTDSAQHARPRRRASTAPGVGQAGRSGS